VQNFSVNTFMLIIVMAWMWTGFCMVIISAALKGISVELLEAARVDGANEWQVFRGIIFPLLLPTLAVVGTTIVITALKAFDIVYVMTGGNFDTQVMAQSMIQEMFTNGNFGRASAVAVVLLITIVPVMAINIRRFNAQEAIR
jgi:alpha-glucoside transport system permease protein